MKRRVIKRLIAVLLALALLPGCTPAMTEPTSPAATPTAVPGSNGYAPPSVNATLYFSDESSALVPMRRTIEIPADQSAAWAVAAELMRGPLEEDVGLYSVVPSDATLKGVEVSGDTVTIDIGSDLWDPRKPEVTTLEDDYLLLRMAMTNSLTDLPGIHYVTVLINSIPLRFDSLPAGPMTHTSLDIMALKNARALESARTRGATPDQAMIYTAETQLYFGDLSGRYLLPEVRKVSYHQFDGITGYANAILREILRGPGDRATMKRLLPNRPDWFTLTPRISVGVTQGLDVSVHEDLYPWLEEEGIDAYLALGSLFLSLMTYCPDLEIIGCTYPESVLSAINSQADTTEMPGEIVVRQNWRDLRRPSFAKLVGASAQLYFPVSDDYLSPVSRALPTDGDKPEAMLRLQALIAGPTRDDDARGVHAAFPPGVSARPDYVRDVSIRGTTAFVTLDQGLIAFCRDRTAAEERLMIYAMVNTLTDQPGISWVRFIMPDGGVPVFSGHIDLSGPFMRAPSLIRY